MTGAILRRVGEHFDKIIMQGIVELALKMPCELRMIEIARMDRENVSVNRDGCVLQIDPYFYHSVILAGGKSQQGMIVEP